MKRTEEIKTTLAVLLCYMKNPDSTPPPQQAASITSQVYLGLGHPLALTGVTERS